VAHAPLAGGNFARFLCDFSVIQAFVRSASHFLRSPRPDKTSTPVPPMACEGESANVPKTSSLPLLTSCSKGRCNVATLHPSPTVTFLYLSLESFLKTIRHHGCPPSYVKFIENNTVVKKREVPFDPAEHFSARLPNFHEQFLPFQGKFMRRSKCKGLLCISNCSPIKYR